MEDTIFISAKDLTSDYLEHHGVLGMKWGVRRYQNKDGSLTAQGRKHYTADISTSRKMRVTSREGEFTFKAKTQEGKGRRKNWYAYGDAGDARKGLYRQASRRYAKTNKVMAGTIAAGTTAAVAILAVSSGAAIPAAAIGIGTDIVAGVLGTKHKNQISTETIQTLDLIKKADENGNYTFMRKDL